MRNRSRKESALIGRQPIHVPFLSRRHRVLYNMSMRPRKPLQLDDISSSVDTTLVPKSKSKVRADRMRISAWLTTFRLSCDVYLTDSDS